MNGTDFLLFDWYRPSIYADTFVGEDGALLLFNTEGQSSKNTKKWKWYENDDSALSRDNEKFGISTSPLALYYCQTMLDIPRLVQIIGKSISQTELMFSQLKFW